MEPRKLVVMNQVEDGSGDTAGEGEGGRNWESSTDIHTLPCVKQFVGIC